MKRIFLKLNTCDHCPHIRITYRFFSHCNHPTVQTILTTSEARLTFPQHEGEIPIPYWCPLEKE